MADAAEYEARIQQLDWSGLRSLWENIVRRDTPDWEPGRAFEYLVLRAFQLDGARVRWPYSIELEDEVVEQIDGAVHWGRLSCLVESKDTSYRISVEDAQPALAPPLGCHWPGLQPRRFHSAGRLAGSLHLDTDHPPVGW